MASSKAKTVAEGWVPVNHGIPSSYNRGCRCDECTRANRERCQRTGNATAHRNRNLAQRVFVGGRWIAPGRDDRHGQMDTYQRFGCRCLACVRANADYQRQWRDGAAS